VVFALVAHWLACAGSVVVMIIMMKFSRACASGSLGKVSIGASIICGIA
jgi:hypothetical protein